MVVAVEKSPSFATENPAPTPDVIRRRAASIRSHWTPSERVIRHELAKLQVQRLVTDLVLGSSTSAA